MINHHAHAPFPATAPHHDAPAMPLNAVPSGTTVALVRIRECPKLRRRLADLGLTVGLPVRVVQNHFTGPLILAVKEDGRLAIGRQMAHKIWVCPYDDETLCTETDCPNPCHHVEAPAAPDARVPWGLGRGHRRRRHHRNQE